MISSYLKMPELLPILSKSSEFSVFRDGMIKNYAGGFQINVQKFPEEQQLEYVLMLSIIIKKNQKIKSSKGKGEQQLIAPIQKNRVQIIQKSKSNEQAFKSFVSTLRNAVHFVQKTNQLLNQYSDLAYHTVLTISNKQQSTFLWMRSKVEYSKQDISKFAAEFEENMQLIDYDKNKKWAMTNLTRNSDSIYVLKAKQKYFYLHYFDSTQQLPDNNPKTQIKVIEQGTLTTSKVSQIFAKKEQSLLYSKSSIRSIQQPTQTQPVKNGSNIAREPSRILDNGEKALQTQNLLTQSSIRDSQIIEKEEKKSLVEDSMIMAIKVKCCKCENKFSEIDCLYWNYLYYCHLCLIDINFDTSDIPAPRVNKFLRERNISNWDYDIQCPECESLTKIKNYNPANKHTRYRCVACSKFICVQHRGNIFSCYCYCPSCNVPTIYLQKLKINFCQNCRVRFCFKCNSKEKNSFCKCVCKYCLGQESKTHQCEPACHACNNKSSKLRICRCGLNICYGCFYAVLEICKQGDTFNCNQSEYA